MDDTSYDGVLIGHIAKRDENVVIGLREFRGARFIDIRTYYSPNEGEWRPTRKGVTIPVEAVGELATIVAQLGETLGFSEEEKITK